MGSLLENRSVSTGTRPGRRDRGRPTGLGPSPGALRRCGRRSASTCWRQLAAAYPDAPVLLSHRASAEIWHRSMTATVLPLAREIVAPGDDDPLVPLFRVLFRDLFTDPDDPADVMAGYDRWLIEVRTEVPPDRLVEWQPGDGWEPICRALGVSAGGRDEDYGPRRVPRSRRRTLVAACDHEEVSARGHETHDRAPLTPPSRAFAPRPRACPTRPARGPGRRHRAGPQARSRRRWRPRLTHEPRQCPLPRRRQRQIRSLDPLQRQAPAGGTGAGADDQAPRRLPLHRPTNLERVARRLVGRLADVDLVEGHVALPLVGLGPHHGAVQDRIAAAGHGGQQVESGHRPDQEHLHDGRPAEHLQRRRTVDRDDARATAVRGCRIAVPPQAGMDELLPGHPRLHAASAPPPRGSVPSLAPVLADGQKTGAHVVPCTRCSRVTRSLSRGSLGRTVSPVPA